MDEDLEASFGRIMGAPNRARVLAVGNAVANPEQAGEAQRLSRETGAPAEVIHEDLPGFKATLQQRKTESAMQKPSILEYVENNPMASQVSNDDWDALHKLGRVAKLFGTTPFTDYLPEAFKQSRLVQQGQEHFADPAINAAKGVAAAWDEYNPATQGTLPSTLTVGKALGQSLLSTVSLPFMPAISIVGKPIGHGLADAEHLIGGYLNPEVAARDDLEKMYVQSRHDAEMALSVIGGGLRHGKRMPGVSTPEEIETFLSIVRGKATREEIDAFLRSKAAQEPVSGPLALPSPETIPAGTGVHPVVDTLHIERAKFDSAGVDKLVELADAAKTKERSPELLSKYLEPITGGRTVGIPVEAIEPLYRASAPEAGDGILGFVPDLARQIEVAKTTGGDVVMPLADYLAWVPKELHTKLAPNLRLREEGVTLEESKELQKDVDKTVSQFKTLSGENKATVSVGKDVFHFTLEKTGDNEVGISWVENAIGGRTGKGPEAYQELASSILPKRLRIGINKGEQIAGSPGVSKSAERVHQKLAERGMIIDEDGKLYVKPNKNLEPPAQATADAVKAEKQALYLTPLFKDAKAAGMTEAAFKAYSRKIERSQTEADEAAVASAEKEVRRRQTAEWKKAEAEISDEVKTDLRFDPTHLADRYFRTGDVPGGIIEKGLKIAESDAVGIDLPKGVVAKNGVPADDLAQVFGFNSGKELLQSLSELNRVRGDESPAQFAAKLQKAEVQARMEQRFGALDRNIYNEAREIALADVQFDLLADELKALALQIKGARPVITKDELVEHMARIIANEPLENALRYESFVRQAGSAGKKAEMALLKGDFAEAFVEKQRQFLSMGLAKEAKVFQKLKTKTDKQINRVLTTESIKSMDQAHLEQARAMLESLGYPNPHPKAMTELLSEFVKASDGQLAISADILDGSVHLQDMTVQQYRDLAKSLDSLMHVGRDVKTVANVHGKAELDNVIHDITAELDRFNLIEQPLNPSVTQRVKALGRWVTAVHLLVERMFDYTDKFNPNGPITAFLDRPLRDSYSNELKLVEQTAGKLRSLGKYIDKSINDLIDNKVLPDEFDRSGFLKMTRNNLRHLMLNMGNESNITKVTKGFGVDAGVVWDLIHDNATKADWQWVQGIWDIFAELKPLADAMQLRDTGVAADTIKSVSVTTPHGEFAGGYAPIIYDKMRSNIEGDIARKGGLFDENYFQATTPHAYTIPRTGYAGALDLTGTYLGNKIQGVIHDIAFREAVRNANKLISNKEFMQEMTKKWSKEYTGLLNGWLKDIANVHNVDDSYAMGAARFAAALRQNIVSTLIAFNPGTYIKHGLTAASMSVERVGAVELAKAVKDIGFAGVIKSARDLVKMEHEAPPAPEFSSALKDVIDPGERGEMTREFILNNSALMRNRQRQYLDSIRGAYESINNSGPLQNLSDIRQMAMMIGRAPVAFSDAMSAMPTWLAAYKAEIAKGSPHVDAVFAADKEVSRAHGSNFIGDKPRVTRTGETMRWVTPLYNFWNHMANNYFQGAWDVASMVRGGDKEPRANMQSLINRMFWLVIIPIAVEEMASPALDEHQESYGVKIAKAIVRHFGASFVGVRDLTNALASGYEPSVGLIGTVARSLTNQARDLRNAIMEKKVSKDWIIHTATALGMATGVGGSQIGKTGSFLRDVARGADVPRNILTETNWQDEWRQGLRTGHSKPRVFK